jgi:hypothetical protein
MSRRLVRGAAAGLLAVALAATPTGAQETEIIGRVDSVLELSLEQAAPDQVRATVTATVPDTELSVSEPGRAARTLRTYRRPTTRSRVSVPAASGRTSVTQTITFGPQSP